MALKLGQIIAIEKGAKSKFCSVTSELYKLMQKNDLFVGLQKKYRPLNESDTETLPEDKKKVQLTVPEVLKKTKDECINYFNITARKDWSNSRAFADIEVDGQKIIENAPMPFILFLEKQLVDLRTMVEKLPLLDEAEDWSKDENTNLFKTGTVSTHRTKKVSKVVVLYPATEQHPAQTSLVNEDVIAGYWDTVKHSGAIPKPQREAMVARIDALLQAVKIAREQANSTEELATSNVGSAIFNYLNWG